MLSQVEAAFVGQAIGHALLSDGLVAWQAGGWVYLSRPMATPEIRILADTVANQIAAGEVVERPAAAAKELLENALDAGARRITIDFSRGGKARMVVEDDGVGMSLIKRSFHCSDMPRVKSKLRQT